MTPITMHCGTEVTNRTDEAAHMATCTYCSGPKGQAWDRYFDGQITLTECLNQIAKIDGDK